MEYSTAIVFVVEVKDQNQIILNDEFNILYLNLNVLTLSTAARDCLIEQKSKRQLLDVLAWSLTILSDKNDKPIHLHKYYNLIFIFQIKTTIVKSDQCMQFCLTLIRVLDLLLHTVFF